MDNQHYKSSTFLTINTSALRYNLQVIRQRVGSAHILAVVKANAYGHGLKAIIHALTSADGFAIFSLDEAVLLREYFPDKPILWLAGFSTPQELGYVRDFNITPLIHNTEQIEMLEKHPFSSTVNIFLMMNVGMNRLGFLPEDFLGAYQRLKQCTQVSTPFVLMTHFPQADIVTSDITPTEAAVFDRYTQNLSYPKCMANSAAIWAWPKTIHNYVRPGISLYGISPFSDRHGKDLGLKPVMTFCSKLIAVDRCKKGAQVGYGGIWTAPRDTYLGIIDVGYSDGYTRHAKNGTPVLINDVLYPLVGRVSMNMIIVDLGPNPQPRINDSVTLWGEGLPVEEVAKNSDTIPYTLVAGISSRIKTIVQP